MRRANLRALASILFTLAIAGAPAVGQELPADYLRMVAMRDQPAAQAIPALARYAEVAKIDEAERARIGILLEEASAALAAGDELAARGKVAEVRAVITGEEWTPARQFAGSLDAQAASPLIARGSQIPVRLSWQSNAAALDARVRFGFVEGGQSLSGGEEALNPARGEAAFDIPVPTGPPGRAVLITEVVVDGQVLRRIEEPVDLVPDLAALEAEARKRLAAVEAGSDARSLVLFPFDLASRIASGERSMEARPFTDRLARSETVLTALEQGHDIAFRGTGKQDRAYRFEETDEILPYQVYVPTTWDGQESLPIILALHGGGGDEAEMLSVDDGKFARLAERYGYIVVAPLGYSPVGAYGSPIRLPSVYGSEVEQGRQVGGPERARLLARSERDTMAVLERTVTEYGADRSRIFLTGHSMGSGGSWYLAHQYPDLWEAVAPSAGPFFIDRYDFDRLRGMGVIILQGAGDPPSLAANRRLASDLLARGIGVNYVETPSADHGQTFGASLPTIFEFFERQKLRENPERQLDLK